MVLGTETPHVLPKHTPHSLLRYQRPHQSVCLLHLTNLTLAHSYLPESTVHSSVRAWCGMFFRFGHVSIVRMSSRVFSLPWKSSVLYLLTLAHSLPLETTGYFHGSTFCLVEKIIQLELYSLSPFQIGFCHLAICT